VYISELGEASAEYVNLYSPGIALYCRVDGHFVIRFELEFSSCRPCNGIRTEIRCRSFEENICICELGEEHENEEGAYSRLDEPCASSDQN
jgi:hypothetical protein